ncbi:S-adenosyl-L-methionine-dependent methyltransferase [Trypanosoma grayi]|uniref:S-adenosyl-L-methionine-dependent methyltransferase n=1 Tax=Trypanosoma grayi TaxID=71804 RepID=UPI0004F462C7|nr:S-adenosyl-L-methionine-dependent methyltransferase [Trypanosoma grayi]KEG08843.1 S-adenosyl-L-methionine-dependent methyltransferase [Trypanosoma grayi]
MPSPVVLTRSAPARALNIKMFDRRLKGLQRCLVDAPACDLHKLCAEQMLDRRAFVRRETPVVLEVGAHTGWFFRHMLEKKQFFGLKQYIQTDICEERLNRNYEEVKGIIPPEVEFVQICCDEEETDPFGIPERTVDMVVSCLSMHWVNDLETAMVNIRKILKKDGFMLHSMFGGNTLYELRGCLSMAQTEVLGGVSPHISPMIDGAGLSTLVLQAGFSLPSIDVDRHLLLYQTPFHLMEHISNMGESACHYMRRPLNRDVLLAACAIYEVMYKKNQLIPATFEVFHTIAWSPSPTQAKPLERGSGQVPLSSWNSRNKKRLQEVLDEFAQNPDNEELQEKAEDLFKQLREESAALLTQKGLDVRGLDGNRDEEAREMEKLKPDPPFQKSEGSKSE